MRHLKVWFPVVRGGSGTDVFTRRLASALGKRGVDTEITYFPTHHQHLPLLLRSSSTPDGTDIIHTNSWNGFVFHGRGIPSVTTDHLGLDPPGSSSYRNLAVRTYHRSVLKQMIVSSLESSTVATSVSRYVASTFTGRISSRIRVIPNWIDTNVYRPDPDIEHPHDPFRLLYVGNMTKRKGADLIVPLAKKLGPDFTVSCTTGLRTVKTLPPLPNMRLLSRVSEEELIELYQASDAVIFPSRLEGFGLVALEAMACGRPVISSRNSAIPEIVEDQKTGLLCTSGNVKALANACRQLSHNPRKMNTLGRRGRERALDLFSEEVVLPMVMGAYEDAAR